MTAEAVTVTCTRHRRHCTVHPGPRGEGVRIYHAEPGTVDPLCDSMQFTVRREYTTSRNGAHAELLALYLNREAMERARAASRSGPSDEVAKEEARENSSAPAGGNRRVRA